MVIGHFSSDHRQLFNHNYFTMRTITKLLVVVLFCLSTTFSNAQVRDTADVQYDRSGNISFVRVKAQSNQKMENAKALLALLLAGEHDDFKPVKEINDKFGMSHLKFQQYYKGIKVENSEYWVHGKNGKITKFNGHFRTIDIGSVQPQITEDAALSNALGFIDAEIYKWEDEGMQSFLREHSGDPTSSYYPEGELVITKNEMKEGKEEEMILAWKFLISSMVPNDEQVIFVDAGSGDIVRAYSLTCEIRLETGRNIEEVNTPSLAETMYSGNLSITSDSFAGGFRLREERDGVDIITLNLNNSDNIGTAADFSNTGTNWTSGNWAGINQDQQALDVHWGAEMVADYWQTVHQRNSIDDSGIRILSYVHYTPNFDGSPINNAFWQGGINARYMLYGDGDSGQPNPLTSLDICAHEFGHGINEFTANLTPGWHETGALNEGFSDIWAACIEDWATSNKATWIMGEEVFSGGFNGLRNLQNPKSTNTAEGQHPDTYQGDYWHAQEEPHFNSTVLSHWFYLLSQGGSGTNDNNDSYTVDGIGLEKAALIAYRMELIYLTSSSEYADARIAAINAAEDIYCENSPEVRAVTDAWYAVGVGGAFSGGIMNISGEDIVCSNTSFSLSNIPSGTNISWSVSPSNLVTSSSGSGATANLTPAASYSSGQATITYTVGNGTCETEIQKAIYVHAGSPDEGNATYSYNGSNQTANPYISVINNIVCDLLYPVTLDVPLLGSEISNVSMIYTSDPNITYWGSGGAESMSINFEFWEYGQEVIFRVSMQNDCGTSYQDYAFRSEDCYGTALNYKVYPNPASESINIELDQDLIKQSVSDKEKVNIKLFDPSGTELMSKTVNESRTTIDVSNLGNGFYYVHIIHKNGIIRKKLRIER